MDCTRCGHPYRNHRLGTELRCRMRIAYGWSEQEKQFAGTCPCLCPGYKGVIPGYERCPHEYVKWQLTCVHCGHAMAAPKKETT